MTNQGEEEYRLTRERPHVPNQEDLEGWAREYSSKIGTDVAETGNPGPNDDHFIEHPDWEACEKILGKEETLRVANLGYWYRFGRDIAEHFGIEDVFDDEDDEEEYEDDED